MIDTTEARHRLNAEIRGRRAAAGLNLMAQHSTATVLYQAIAHALCYLAQLRGMDHDELCKRLRGQKPSQIASLSMSDRMRKRLETSLGLVRTTEPERQTINRTLARVYGCVHGLSLEQVFGLFVPWLAKFAPQVGVPTEIMLTRIENLDALTRFAGAPKAYIPEDQYGL